MSVSVKRINERGIIKAQSSTKSISQSMNAVDKPDLSHLPSSRGLPFLGHMVWFVTDLLSWLQREHRKHGSVFRFHMPVTGEGVFLLGPEANRLVLKNQNQVFSNELSWGPQFEGVFDNAVLAKDFINHKSLRKLLQLAFKREAIEGHMVLMNPIIDEGVSNWPVDKKVKGFYLIKNLLLDAGANIFLGLDIGSEAKLINKAFLDLQKAAFDPFRNEKIPFSPYATARKARSVLERFVLKNIPERRQGSGRDIFSQLCRIKDEEGYLLTDEEIRDQVIFLLFAAHDTTTSTLCSVLFALASNPVWQKKLRQEMNSLDKDVMAFDDIEKMAKATLIIKEALRLYPPLGYMPRYALKDFEFNNHRIPKGTCIWIAPVFTHHMPDYWSKPECFDPYRFSAERGEDKKDFYQYIPFGGGAHKCLGMHFAEIQTKMFLFHFLKRYQVSLGKCHRFYKRNQVPITMPANGLPIIIKPIS